MSFFTNLRADRLVTEIRSSNDPTGAATQKAVARLKDVGPSAIESVLTALPDADKGSTMAFVEVLAGLVSQKTFPQFMRGLVEGSPRVVSGISWALTSSRNYPPHLLLEALAIPGISKPTVLEVIAAQKTRFSVRELLASAYTQEPNEKAALFRVIGEIADQQAIPELIGRVQGKDPIARVHIINTLARFNTPEVQTALQGLLKDPNKLIRGATLSALQRMNGPIDIERVCALLRDPEIDVLNRAIDVVIKANHPETIRYLIEVLKDENENARRAAVEVLNEIGNAKSVKYLLEALKDSDWWVRSRAADALGKIGGAAANPPVAVLERFQQVLDGFGVADLVQHLDRGTARVLVLVLEHLDQVADGFRVVGLDDHVDGPVENVDLRVPQQRAHALDINGPVHALQRRQRGSADQLVGILQQSLQRRLHLGGVEARQGVDDVHARNGVLALHAADQLGDRLLVGNLADDAEQRRLLVGLLRIGRSQQLPHAETRLLRRDHFQHRGLGDSRYRERFEQQVRRIVAAAGQCPGNPGDHARTAFHQAAHELWERLLADEPGEHLDEGHGG